MYEQHFGLSSSPFSTSPDPRFIFFTPSHREALAGLIYGILNQKGFIALIGEAGTGKTSLLRRVLQNVGGNMSLVLNPAVAAAEFTKLAMLNFGIEKVSSSKAEQLIDFEHFLRRSREQGRLSVLVVDEAQRLSPDVLEEIRVLTNYEDSNGKLLQIVLAGQSELKDTLNRPDLRQLKQRIDMRLTLKPLSGPGEVGEYIRHRWKTAGAVGAAPFSAEAIDLITRYSTSVPRVVNVLCDNALLLAFADGVQSVALHHVGNAALELDLVDSAGGLNPPVSLNGTHASKESRGLQVPVSSLAELHNE